MRSPKQRHSDKDHVGVQARILICQIRVGNVVILVSKIDGGAAAGCEQLHTSTKLSSKVELLGGSEHSVIEVQKSATACEKRFDSTEVNEIYLCTDRTAADPVCICSVTIAGMRITDECHRNRVENPAHGEGSAEVDKPLVAAFELIISCTDGARKRMPVFKSSAEPIRVLAVRTLLFLCGRSCYEKNSEDDRGDKRVAQSRKHGFPSGASSKGNSCAIRL